LEIIMASLLLKNGRYSLQFTPRTEPRRKGELKPKHPRRQSVALGEVGEHQANLIKKHVEELVKSQGKREPNSATAKWRDFIAEHDDGLYRALLRVGLVPERLQDQQAAAAVEAEKPNTLARFVDDYIKRRADAKGGTRVCWGHTRRCLVEFFGATRPLGNITPSEADDFRRWLKSDQGLAENSTRRRCSLAKQFFRDALRRRLIAENPFADMKNLTVKGDEAKQYFVTREEADAVLAECPDAEWRLLFALSRFGGLRCPSEHLELRWQDINWERDRFTAKSPKTEHHEGKESRVVPIFAELRPYLEAVWEEAEEGAVYVITRHRQKNMNLRTQLLRMIAKAGLKPWPKLFHNLRATRETELADEYPIKTVCEWIGNSPAIAAEHYLQVTEEHFQRAAASETRLHSELHSSGATPCNAMHGPKTPNDTTPPIARGCVNLPSLAETCTAVNVVMTGSIVDARAIMLRRAREAALSRKERVDQHESDCGGWDRVPRTSRDGDTLGGRISRDGSGSRHPSDGAGGGSRVRAL
jgi:integrase